MTVGETASAQRGLRGAAAWVVAILATAAAAILTYHYVATAMRDLIPADLKATPPLTMSDFRDAIWYPVKDMVGGGNPYDFVAYTATHLGEYPPYTPAQLTLFWPFAAIGWESSALVFVVLMCATVLGIGSWVGIALLGGLRGRAWARHPAVPIAVAALGVVAAWIYRPIPAAFGPGQPSLVYASAAAAALLATRSPRAVRVVLVAIACLKPTIGFPVLLLLICKKGRRADAVWGFVLVLALSIPAVVVMSRAAGGFGSWVATTVSSVIGTQDSRLADTGGATADDLWVDLFTLSKTLVPGLSQAVVLVVCVIILMTAVALAVHRPWIWALGSLTVLTAALVTEPHGGYDSLWLFAPALFAIPELRTVPNRVGRLLLSLGLVVSLLGGMAISHLVDGLVGGLSATELQRFVLLGATLLLVAGLAASGKIQSSVPAPQGTGLGRGAGEATPQRRERVAGASAG